MPVEPYTALLNALKIPSDALPVLEPVITLRVLYHHHQECANEYASKLVNATEQGAIIDAIENYVFHRAAALKLAEYLNAMRLMCTDA